MYLCRFLPLAAPAGAAPLRGFASALAADPSATELRVYAGDPLAPRPTGETHRLAGVRLLPPVEPSKIVCVGKNYLEHVREMGGPAPEEPVLFLKPPSSLVAPGEPILLPPASRRVECEGEIAVVIGRRCRNARAAEAWSYVLGVTAGDDVTARDLQASDKQWTRAKGFDTFLPLGPFVKTGCADPAGLEVVTRLGGREIQRGRAADMRFPIPFLVEYISAVMTLEPGDVILTGTPAGVHPLAPGDVVEVTVDGDLRLANPVAAG